MQHSSSFTQQYWNRLKKNGGALAGLVIISLSILTGLFAYYIAPDSSPNANRQIVEIQSKKPGYHQQFLLLKKERKVEKASLVSRLLFGQEEQYLWVPIESYEEFRDSVTVQKLIDEDIYEEQTFARSSLANSFLKEQTFLLGTDKFGRDILSRLLVGVRVSLAVGLITVLISLTIGIALGAAAGYFGGKTDDAIVWFINVVWSMPTLLLVFGLTLTLGKGFWQIFIAVGLTMWVGVARVIRGQVLSLRELEYIQAAKALGFKDLYVILRHILPNVMGPVMVIAAANFASAIIIEAGLSFLGIGIQPPTPSWGLMIKENYNFIITNNPALALAPGVAIMILVLAFNLLGNGLRDAIDVRS